MSSRHGAEADGSDACSPRHGTWRAENHAAVKGVMRELVDGGKTQGEAFNQALLLAHGASHHQHADHAQAFHHAFIGKWLHTDFAALFGASLDTAKLRKVGKLGADEAWPCAHAHSRVASEKAVANLPEIDQLMGAARAVHECFQQAQAPPPPPPQQQQQRPAPTSLARAQPLQPVPMRHHPQLHPVHAHEDGGEDGGEGQGPGFGGREFAARAAAPPPQRGAFMTAGQRMAQDNKRKWGGGGGGGGGGAGGYDNDDSGYPKRQRAFGRGGGRGLHSFGRRGRGDEDDDNDDGGDDDLNEAARMARTFGLDQAPSRGAPPKGIDPGVSKIVRAVPLKRSSGYAPPRISEQQQRQQQEESEVHPLLRNVDPQMVETIENEIVQSLEDIVCWEDIAGLEKAKRCVKEIIIDPMLRPELFTGLRNPSKGVLLFGPPGTGKTLIGKAIASQCGATFFSISASALTSKWTGDAEKMVRALFAVARVKQPSVIFVDEIDSVLCQRSENDADVARRLKTEFLVQFDGCGTSKNDRLVLIGATNRPQELDEAVRRRMQRRLYIPLPNLAARLTLITNLVSRHTHSLSQEQFEEVARNTKGYSGSDLHSLCSDAAYGPLREVDDLRSVRPEDLRPINMDDFTQSLHAVRASVSPKDLTSYLEWNATYGGYAVDEDPD